MLYTLGKVYIYLTLNSTIEQSCSLYVIFPTMSFVLMGKQNPKTQICLLYKMFKNVKACHIECHGSHNNPATNILLFFPPVCLVTDKDDRGTKLGIGWGHGVSLVFNVA